MRNIETLISDFKRLTRKEKQEKQLTIDKFIEKQPREVWDELAPRLYFHMFRAWLHPIATSRVVDFRRKQNAQKRGSGFRITSIDDTDEQGNHFLEEIQDLGSDPTEAARVNEILATFDQLSKRDKQIVSLYILGYNNRQMGEVLGLKTDTVRKANNRATQKLQAILRKMGYRQ